MTTGNGKALGRLGLVKLTSSECTDRALSQRYHHLGHLRTGVCYRTLVSDQGYFRSSNINLKLLPVMQFLRNSAIS